MILDQLFENTEPTAMAQAVTRRILLRHSDLLSRYGVEAVTQAIDDVTQGDDWEEIGSSDVSAYVRYVEDYLRDHHGSREEMADRKPFAETDVAEVVKMPPTKNSSQGMADWAYQDAQDKKVPLKGSLKGIPTEVYDMGDHLRVFVKDEQGPVLYLALNKFLDGFKSGAVAVEPRGRGKNLAVRVYQAASDTFGRPIYSDTTQTDASRIGIWQKLMATAPDRVVGYDQQTREDLPLTATDRGPAVRGNQPVYTQRTAKDLSKPVSDQNRSRTRLLKLLPNQQEQMREQGVSEPGRRNFNNVNDDDLYAVDPRTKEIIAHLGNPYNNRNAVLIKKRQHEEQGNLVMSGMRAKFYRDVNEQQIQEDRVVPVVVIGPNNQKISRSVRLSPTTKDPVRDIMRYYARLGMELYSIAGQRVGAGAVAEGPAVDAYMSGKSPAIAHWADQLDRIAAKNESRTICPECGGAAYQSRLLAEKKDACYHKVRSRYKVWPSAYASGALVQCRKKGADNWGTGGGKK